ncbi:MAG: hypothetical protein HZB44_02220 [Actinobacteria bacterium]|nr:hypothetical protein [Actinomycetota bacterium]
MSAPPQILNDSQRSKLLKFLLLSLVVILILSGCSENKPAESTQLTQTTLIDIDYSLFVKKVKDKQVESVMIYPADQMLLVYSKEDNQKYRFAYSSNNQITALLIENEIPFEVEEPIGARQ